jgi:hypothetical protein
VHTCKQGRTPLLSLNFPTIKDKISDLNKSRQDRFIQYKTHSLEHTLHSDELKRVVHMEATRRGTVQQTTF